MPPSASTSIINIKNMKYKVDDLESSVTYLADQNIALQKCLDTSNQLVSKLEQRLVILGEQLTFLVFFLHSDYYLFRNCRESEKRSREK